MARRPSLFVVRAIVLDMGEARPRDVMLANRMPNESREVASDGHVLPNGGQPGWYAIWTRSRSEQLAADQLTSQGFDIFNPTVLAWITRYGARRRRVQPLFPGYIFVHHTMDKAAQVEILKTRGVVRLLGERWDRLEPIPAPEIEAVRRIVESGSAVRRHDFVPGDRVRIVAGPLTGLTGTFVRSRGARGLFLVSITLLRRSVAVEVDRALVEAA
jgi:transcriptional antiterminator RfaH